MRRIKAFTVLELLVAMVISSLVISASYFTYDIIYKQYLNYKQVDRGVLDVLTFKNVLSNDLASATYMFMVSNGISIINAEGIEFNYAIGQGYIVRNVESARDTFFVQSSELKYHELKGNSVAVGLMEKFELIVTLNETPLSMSFIKRYGADVLMLANSEEM